MRPRTRAGLNRLAANITSEQRAWKVAALGRQLCRHYGLARWGCEVRPLPEDCTGTYDPRRRLIVVSWQVVDAGEWFFIESALREQIERAMKDPTTRTPRPPRATPTGPAPGAPRTRKGARHAPRPLARSPRVSAEDS